MTQSANSPNAGAEFVFSRTLDAPREDVWEAFTQPEHLQHWWGTPGTTLEVAHHDLRPGGMFLYCMKFPDGRATWARFIFREIVVPERLVWINAFSDEQGGLATNPWMSSLPRETLNTVTFAEENGKTLLTISVVPFNASVEESGVFAGAIPGMKAGFGSAFNTLADYLARRRAGARSGQ